MYIHYGETMNTLSVEDLFRNIIWPLKKNRDDTESISYIIDLYFRAWLEIY